MQFLYDKRAFSCLCAITLFQQPFRIRLLIEYLPCELCIGNNPFVPIILQCVWADIQPLTYFFTCEEVLTAKERLVCLCHFLNSLAYSAD